MKKLFALFILFLSAFAHGQTIPTKPSPPTLVNDYTNTLSPNEAATLEQKLVAFDNATTNQIVVVVVRSLEGMAPAEYALKLGRAWGVGNEKNNGVVLLIALADRTVNISPGNGLEGALPDITCKQIIDNDIRPAFKASNYFDGINNALESIIKATKGEYQAPAGYNQRGRKKGGGWGSFIFIIIIIIIALVGGGRRGGGGGMMSRRGYGGASNALWLLPFLGGGGGSSSGGGGSSSGGFGGFGGGSFGGGGASGSW